MIAFATAKVYGCAKPKRRGRRRRRRRRRRGRRRRKRREKKRKKARRKASRRGVSRRTGVARQAESSRGYSRDGWSARCKWPWKEGGGGGIKVLHRTGPVTAIVGVPRTPGGEEGSVGETFTGGARLLRELWWVPRTPRESFAGGARLLRELWCRAHQDEGWLA